MVLTLTRYRWFITPFRAAKHRGSTIGKRIPTKRLCFFSAGLPFKKVPDYFVEAAARVLKEFPEVTFVMAGAGDMMPRMIERVAELHIGKNFHFTGFLQGTEVSVYFP